MNRHHPYAGNYDAAPRRGAPGPDRPFRGAPRGRGRGRGGGGSSGSMHSAPVYDSGPSASPYESMPPSAAPHSDLGYYNQSQYGAPPAQEHAYSNGNYNGPPAASAPPPPVYGANPYGAAPNGYDQPYRGYEDGAGARAPYDYGAYSAPPDTPVPPRDEKVHDSLISDRVNRERPCRTLFIRNIKYETNTADVRGRFEEHGEVKTFFDLIANRGMIFVTYYDLRAAERARDRMQNSEIAGRPIDVHYSLPRDEEKSVETQGTIVVTLRNSSQPIDEHELRRRLQPMGDIKAIRPMDHNRPNERVIEFYDLRACDMAMDRLQHQGLQDGIMEIAYGWSDDDMAGPRGALRKGGNFDRGGRDFGDEGPRGRRTRGGRGRRGRGGPADNFDRPPPREWDGRPRQDDGFGPERSRDRFDARGPGGGYDGGRPSSPPPPPMMGGPGGYGPPPSAPPYRDGPMPPSMKPPQQSDDRLEQARKVQQLLAALQQPPPSAPPAAPPAAPSAPSYYGQAQSAPASLSYPGAAPSYGAPGAPPVSYANTAPPAGPPAVHRPYGSLPTPAPAPPSNVHLPPNLPPNVLAMLQQATQAQPTAHNTAPPQGNYGAPPPDPRTHFAQTHTPTTNGPPPGQPTYEQLMALFQNQAAAAQRH